MEGWEFDRAAEGGLCWCSVSSSCQRYLGTPVQSDVGGPPGTSLKMSRAGVTHQKRYQIPRAWTKHLAYTVDLPPRCHTGLPHHSNHTPLTRSPTHPLHRSAAAAAAPLLGACLDSSRSLMFHISRDRVWV